MNSDQGKCIRKALSAVLQRLIENNDSRGETGSLSKFHAQRVPGISVSDYVARLMKYAGCSFEALVLSLVYVDRLIQRNGFVLCSLNVHRVCVTSIMLGAKFFDDTYYNNAYFARIGGLPVGELNRLEIDFLYMINFSLHVTSDTFHRYFSELRDHVLAMYPRGGLGPGPLPVESVERIDPLCFHLHNACYTTSDEAEQRCDFERADLARLEGSNREAELLVEKAIAAGLLPPDGRPGPVRMPAGSHDGRFFPRQSQQKFNMESHYSVNDNNEIVTTIQIMPRVASTPNMPKSSSAPILHAPAIMGSTSSLPDRAAGAALVHSSSEVLSTLSQLNEEASRASSAGMPLGSGAAGEGEDDPFLAPFMAEDGPPAEASPAQGPAASLPSNQSPPSSHRASDRLMHHLQAHPFLQGPYPSPQQPQQQLGALAEPQQRLLAQAQSMHELRATVSDQSLVEAAASVPLPSTPSVRPAAITRRSSSASISAMAVEGPQPQPPQPPRQGGSKSGAPAPGASTPPSPRQHKPSNNPQGISEAGSTPALHAAPSPSTHPAGAGAAAASPTPTPAPAVHPGPMDP